jgi:predicted acylesterase/phospholipase RssA
MSVEPEVVRSGFVLSGGGAYAAYEVGVMRALLTGASPATDFQPVNGDVVAGTSAGSVNAAILVARADDDPLAAIDYLERVWTTRLADEAGACGSHVLRLRANPLNLLNPACLSAPSFYATFAEDIAFLAGNSAVRAQNFLASGGTLRQRLVESFDLGMVISGQPLRDVLGRIVDFEAIRTSRRQLRISATNWRTGELRVFANSDIDRANGVNLLLASSAIPGVFPSVDIDNEPYVDGGVVMNTPLQPAIQAGASDLHVVYMDPDVEQIPLPRMRNTLNTLYRMLVISFGLTVSRDIGVAAAINRRLRHDEEAAYTTVVSGEVRAQKYRLLTIHRYHPSDDLGGTFRWLDFDRDHILRLIDRGYEEASAHDCRVNRCVVPGQDAAIAQANRP